MQRTLIEYHASFDLSIAFLKFFYFFSKPWFLSTFLIYKVVRKVNSDPPAFQRDRGVTSGWALSMLYTSLSTGSSLRWDLTGSRILPRSYLHFFHRALLFLTSCEGSWNCSCLELDFGLDLALPGTSLPFRELVGLLLSPLDSPHPFCLYYTTILPICQ